MFRKILRCHIKLHQGVIINKQNFLEKYPQNLEHMHESWAKMSLNPEKNIAQHFCKTVFFKLEKKLVKSYRKRI